MKFVYSQVLPLDIVLVCTDWSGLGAGLVYPVLTGMNKDVYLHNNIYWQRNRGGDSACGLQTGSGHQQVDIKFKRTSFHNFQHNESSVW